MAEPALSSGPTRGPALQDPARYRPAPGSIPEEPGVYRFADAHGRVIYVGKAKSLRQRLNSYFADISGLHPRTRQMVTTATSVEWTVVSTEVEALQLEYNWIKEFDPRFNVRYRDDKTYPVLQVTMGEEFPRVQVMRGAKRKGTRYFGPYAHAWAIRETLDTLTEEMASSGAARDGELLQLAQALLEKSRSTQGGTHTVRQRVVGDGNVVAGSGDITINVDRRDTKG